MLRTCNMKPVVLIAALCLLVSTGCRPPSERAVYRVACDAVRAQPGVPGNVSLARIGDAELYVGKNAAMVELPCEYVNLQGETVKTSYTVRVKRVARTWTLDRCFPTPAYDE